MKIQDNIKLFIVENDRELCNNLCNFFRKDKEIEVIGYTNEGEKSIELIKKLKPDFVLLDLIMPNIDGLSLLRRIKKGCKKEEAPRVIIISVISDHTIINRAISEGATYYIQKPIILEILKETLILIHQDHNENNNIENEIKKLVTEIGVPVKLSGFIYIVDAIKQLHANNNKVITTGEIYNSTAESNLTSSSCVEMAIKNTIKKTHSINNEKYKEIFGNYEDKMPTNTTFLKTLQNIL